MDYKTAFTVAFIVAIAAILAVFWLLAENQKLVKTVAIANSKVSNIEDKLTARIALHKAAEIKYENLRYNMQTLINKSRHNKEETK